MNPGVVRSASEKALVPGEFAFTASDFQRIAAILHADSGIHLPEGKATLVYSRLAKRLRQLGLESFKDYCALISGVEGVDERQAMLTALTTNVTRFFREEHHFEHLRDQVLPTLAAQARRGGRVRLWSAGCSSGEEPYSLALTLIDAIPDAAELDVKVLASDIDSAVVARARRGWYDEEAAAAIPAPLRTHLRREEGGWCIGPEPRRLIAFRELNLLGAWPFAGAFQVIFCRNVAIYFEEPTQQALWGRFAARLTPDGRLYIGHSERANHPSLATDGLTTYRLREAAR
jgi:chemotaxis protein methyltransferase CheR